MFIPEVINCRIYAVSFMQPKSYGVKGMMDRKMNENSPQF